MIMMSHLPQDLLEEILSRVPATSLERLRSTCKQWNKLFNDYRFVMKNFNNAPHVVILGSRSEFYSVSVNYRDIHNNLFVDPSLKVSCEFSQMHTPFKLDQVYLIQWFHCDGLLLFFTEDRKLMVGNPCNGQTRWIPYSYDGNTLLPMFALGYENKSCHNYKLLRYQTDRIFEFEIYDFSSNIWRILNGFTRDWATDHGDGGVSLKGNTYWIAHIHGDDYAFLLRFDFTTEIFERVSLPEDCERFERLRLPEPCKYRHASTALSVVKDEKLTFLYQNYKTLKMEIWVTTIDMNDCAKGLSWTKFLTMDPLTHPTSFHQAHVRNFFIDEERKLAMTFNMCNMVYVIRDDDKCKFPIKVAANKFSWPRFLHYAPSLVQI